MPASAPTVPFTVHSPISGYGMQGHPVALQILARDLVKANAERVMAEAKLSKLVAHASQLGIPGESVAEIAKNATLIANELATARTLEGIDKGMAGTPPSVAARLGARLCAVKDALIG